MRRERWCRVLIVGFTAIFWVTPPAAAERPSIAAVIDGMRVVQSATYRVDPKAAVVHVKVVTELTNQSPSTREGDYIRSLYLASYGIPMVAEATKITATSSDGSALPVSMEAGGSPRFRVARVDLQPDLFYPDTQKITVTYDIPSQPARSDRATRVNAAYALFPVQALGDPGLSNVEIIVPDSFEVETSPKELTREDRGAEDAYVARGITDPNGFFTVVSARNDAALVDSVVKTGDVTATVQAWPGDAQWGRFVADHVRRGLPALGDLIGQPWPGDKTLDIIETASPYIYGYAGWYYRTQSLIEIGDKLDPVVIMHELSHAWFNDKLIANRWINEALCEEYGREVARRLGAKPPALARLDRSAAGAQPLNSWTRPTLDESASDERERYGYRTSVALLHEIRNEIGFDGLAKVLDAAFDRTLAYSGPGPLEHSTTDWQRFLDLLEEVGGSKTAAGLFRTYAVAPEDVARLTTRATSRATYAKLKAKSGDWSPPFVVRQSLGWWNFDTADKSMAVARGILDKRDQIAAVLAPSGLPVPKALQEAYETAKTADALAEVAGRANALLDAARAVANAEAAVHGPRGLAEKLGLLFADPGPTLRQAEAALDAGDEALATERARTAQRATERAQAAGVKRAGGGLAVIGACAGAVVLLRRRRRNRLDRQPPVVTEAPPTLEPTEPPVADEVAYEVADEVADEDVEERT